jgi:Holliday junction DNA helicase RuvA
VIATIAILYGIIKVVYYMYEYIKGIFIGIFRDYLVIENGGIGYKIFTSGGTMAKMPKINEPVLLYVEQIVREDFIGLYGFLTKDEIKMFKTLLTINGVGSRAALSLLSISNITNLKYAILSGDEKTLTKAPGIGKKIAQRIILELQDKIKLEEGYNKEMNFPLENENNNNCFEALSALLALGYSEKESEQALKAVDINGNVETIIKACLKHLMN